MTLPSPDELSRRKRMRRNAWHAMIAAAILFIAVDAGEAKSVAEALQADFPQIKSERISPSPMPGLYEIVTKNGILYYAPESHLIIAGEMYGPGNRHLPQDRRRAMIKEKVKDIPLDKAFRIGTGPRKVIEITNPDCGYCRKASAFLSARKDLSRFILFLPFSLQTENKIRHILCAPDRARAYEEAMTGKLQGDKLSLCNTQAVEEQIRAHKEIAKNLGVNATPLFVVDGQVLQGADMPALERLLGTTP
jgi:thiol:disulfide interchange protein DsbC